MPKETGAALGVVLKDGGWAVLLENGTWREATPGENNGRNLNNAGQRIALLLQHRADLLEAAKEVGTLLGQAQDPRFIDAYERLNAAIARAESKEVA